MKLIFAVVNDDDGNKVVNALNEKKFSVTRLCSTGGFLKAGNTTLLTVVEETKVDEAIDIIKSRSKSRKQVVNSFTGQPGNTVGFMPYPVEVVVGGATIFVLNVERFEKA
jgi:uncharacterized protein YaaQ